MSHQIRLIFLYFLIITTAQLVGFTVFAQSPQFKQFEKVEEKKITQYSKDLELILKVAHKHFGISEIYIGGGTARSLILSKLQGKAFTFRDFDLVFPAHQEISAEAASHFGLELEKLGLGKFSKENLRPRPRYNPALEDTNAKKYNAGFGFFVNSSQGVEYDISIYHSDEAMDLNGILNIDRFRIRLKLNESLEYLVRNNQRFREAIVDPAEALNTLLENKPPIISNWGEVNKSPSMVAIRIVRTLAKFNVLMDHLTQKKLHQLITLEKTPDSLQISRNLLKLFEDASFFEEFKLLEQIGLFTNQFKSFSHAIQNKNFKNAQTIEEKIISLLESANNKDSLLFLKLLSPLEPQLIKNILPWLIEHKKIKVGYFTGEFSPFHRGHEGVVRTALTDGGLDLIFVAAVPHSTNNPKTENFSAAEWAERRSFVQAGLKDIPEAWSWPLPGMKADKNLNVENLVTDIELFLNNPKILMTHVFGMDSYYRVLFRDILSTDPRPRIVVTRNGVPIPDEHKNLNVRIYQNVEDRPISASRLLQEVAVKGTSDYLSADVVKLVQQIPRYKNILTNYLHVHQSIDNHIAEAKDYSEKVLYWDIRECHAGIWADELIPFSTVHKNILERLIQLKPKKIVLTMYGTTAKDLAAKKTWEKILKMYPSDLMTIRTQSQHDNIHPSNQVMVRHSGILNESIKKSNYEDWLRSRGLIIFETSDQPVSPLFENLRKALIIKSEPTVTKNILLHGLRCENLFKAI